jgi:hypothetical protein
MLQSIRIGIRLSSKIQLRAAPGSWFEAGLMGHSVLFLPFFLLGTA